MIETLKALFTRDLERLRKEIELYNNEHNLWKIEADILNSAGNLCLHLIGNLNTYIGKKIGKTDYIRNRELEFSLKDIPKLELLKKIDETILVVNQSLGKLSEEELQNEYPIIVFDKPTTYEYFLIHLTTHLGYHLGQINYHRRLLDK
ncbi:DUF1572 family protein [Pedobacter fastidiosus]|uniref:DUF1572 family protein n=1 Tax=Pedobacter fastidiosus TaxID=2765361 RepID=A0ABR7KZA1_9SPHI|nr:DUF1572 family protein [Pedobacter fastidiosus]MBC6113150.1 DUF1572 family protein [Pedobacter fastidiosus]